MTKQNRYYLSLLCTTIFIKSIHSFSATPTKLSPFRNNIKSNIKLYQSDRILEKVNEQSISSNDDNSDAILSILQRTESSDEEYKRGLLTIGFITLLFSSMSPAMHAALVDTSNSPPPVLLLNAVVSIIALSGLLFAGPLLESAVPLPRSLKEQDIQLEAGLELGLWKFLGTTANLYGLSYTTADHGAFLIQLTTLIVPSIQGLMGVPIPTRIKTSIVLALSGVYLFTQDTAGSCTASAPANLPLGDALCILAAIFYATYDLRLFKYGKLVKPRELITGKIITQAILSTLLLLLVGYNDAVAYVSNATFETTFTVALLAVWSGLAVNAIAPFLQVGGQQAIGPTRAQTLYASQPLWASIISFVFLGEVVGYQGFIGGFAFLSALFLAATADPPDENCGVDNCEV